MTPPRLRRQGHQRDPPTATAFQAGDVLASVLGPARSMLQAERVALNFPAAHVRHRHADRSVRFCGRGHPAYASSTPARPPLGCARSNGTPWFCGGGHNHRFSLSDAVMAKDNHLALVDDVTTAIREAAGRSCRTRRTSRSRSTGSTRSSRCWPPARSTRSCSTTSTSTSSAPRCRDGRGPGDRRGQRRHHPRRHRRRRGHRRRRHQRRGRSRTASGRSTWPPTCAWRAPMIYLDEAATTPLEA